MKLTKNLEGRKIRIIDIDGEIFEGDVTDYFYPEDNEPKGVAGIAIDNCPQRPDMWIGFNENEIKSIEILD